MNFYIINRYDGKVAALNKVRNYYQDTLAFWVEAGYGAVFANTPPYGISRDVYDELLTTGNLRKIRHERLRNEINAYYAFVKRADSSAEDYRSGYRNFIDSLRPFSGADTGEIQEFDRQLMLRHLQNS